MFKRLFGSTGRGPKTESEGAASRDKRAGSGESFEDAIVIQATSSADGVPKEYEWLEKRFGRRNRDWEMKGQFLTQHDNRMYDVIEIRLADGSEKAIHFDVSGFFGKPPS